MLLRRWYDTNFKQIVTLSLHCTQRGITSFPMGEIGMVYAPPEDSRLFGVTVKDSNTSNFTLYLYKCTVRDCRCEVSQPVASSVHDPPNLPFWTRRLEESSLTITCTYGMFIGHAQVTTQLTVDSRDGVWTVLCTNRCCIYGLYNKGEIHIYVHMTLLFRMWRSRGHMRPCMKSTSRLRLRWSMMNWNTLLMWML